MKNLLLLQLRELSRWLEIQLTLMLYKVLPPKVAWMFCLLDLTYGGPRGQFRRNGGVHLATTMCWLLLMPNMKRYLLACDFRFDLVVFTLLLLSLGHAEGKRGNRGYAHWTVPGANPEELVDAEVAKNVKEKWSSSNGFDDTGIAHDRTSDDVEEGERVEMWFWCALLDSVKYCLYRYFVDFVNSTCRA
jgi:hypothetical protein